ncbi:MAG: hypothetical protein JSW38_02780 [Dehalococcoidia bacterium]|nr:MAG: hypothetical protein JSW38_02780 [Dehalococcoidia bacterium]
MSPNGDFTLPPEELENYGKVLSNWDDEDVSTYRDIMEAREDVELLGGNILVEMDESTAEALIERARERGIDPSRMASEILRSILVDGE